MQVQTDADKYQTNYGTVQFMDSQYAYDRLSNVISIDNLAEAKVGLSERVMQHEQFPYSN